MLHEQRLFLTQSSWQNSNRSELKQWPLNAAETQFKDHSLQNGARIICVAPQMWFCQMSGAEDGGRCPHQVLMHILQFQQKNWDQISGRGGSLFFLKDLCFAGWGQLIGHFMGQIWYESTDQLDFSWSNQP